VPVSAPNCPAVAIYLQTLCLSLSFDHRIIGGAEAAPLTGYLSSF
jgi:pyruvate/2-oxoglutarate dehydrogenase complex dihydrolipoamide acyltransferase (E2) component